MTVRDPRPLVLPNIEALKPYVPGKPVEELERELGIKGAIKLASNENAAGSSPRALEALAHLPPLAEYPDGSCFHLRRALATHVGVTPEEIFTGGGSNEIIDLLVRTFCAPGDDEVLSFSPSFICYELAPKAHGCRLVQVPLDERTYAYDPEALLSAVTPRTRILFLSNPNNPTGSWMSRAALEHLASKLPQDIILCVDEAYCEFSADRAYPDACQLRPLREHMVVLRTFSKIYGLAALRCGYGIMAPRLVNYLDRVRLPFNVSVPAQVAAIAALQDGEHVRRSAFVNAEGLAQVEAGLDRIAVKRFPTQANFVFVDLERDGRDVYQALLHKGVITRPIGGPRHLRITIGTREQNDRMLRALGEVLGRS